MTVEMAIIRKKLQVVRNNITRNKKLTPEIYDVPTQSRLLNEIIRDSAQEQVLLEVINEIRTLEGI